MTDPNALAHWSAFQWALAIDAQGVQAVDVPALLAAWGLPSAGPVSLSPERNAWVEGVLASEIEPAPVPEME